MSGVILPEAPGEDFADEQPTAVESPRTLTRITELESALRLEQEESTRLREICEQRYDRITELEKLETAVFNWAKGLMDDDSLSLFVYRAQKR